MLWPMKQLDSGDRAPPSSYGQIESFSTMAGRTRTDGDARPEVQPHTRPATTTPKDELPAITLAATSIEHVSTLGCRDARFMVHFMV